MGDCRDIDADVLPSDRFIEEENVREAERRRHEQAGRRTRDAMSLGRKYSKSHSIILCSIFRWFNLLANFYLCS
jgi:hypothetical protein